MQQSALDVLSDLLLRYIGEMGATTRSYAELGHRTEPTADDVVRIVPGLTGAASSKDRASSPSERGSAAAASALSFCVWHSAADGI
jgi:Bromodomain associated